ncbi:RelA/SpoT domain-containing protein [Methylobacterium sp. sgz302541]|uniref:RelA/SpoT domain-containing protein n=1 Tax=unclassified Methylobacterium TaxID=2615210 RepID=UPI003D3384A1
MASQNEKKYPGGSKERVRRAGNAVRENKATIEDYNVIEEWRAAHRAVLNTFQAILRTRTRGTGIVVAQRHKRRNTIFGKLHRHKTMQLHRMDDVAGCRLIFEDIKKLYEFREKFHKAKFRHKLRNEIDKYDYIKIPKVDTGYRGVHDVYEYDVNSQYGENFKGLYIEIQYRTRYQHAWATCVEVIGFITENQPKFNSGDKRYQKILEISSEIIARSFEDRTSSMAEVKDDELIKNFLALDKELGFMNLLRGLNSQEKEVSEYKNMILIFSEGRALNVKHFRDATDALRALFDLERENPGQDIVLVRADTTEEIRIAFKNYFSDAQDFIHLIDAGCEKLSHKKVMRPAKRQKLGKAM